MNKPFRQHSDAVGMFAAFGILESILSSDYSVYILVLNILPVFM